MEEYKDLDLTIAVFTKLLDEPAFLGLEAGIVLQAYLPDALAAMEQLQEWSAARRARGGAGIKVRLVKGANLPMEQVEASVHGWPLATWHTKQDSDTNYKRVLDWALTLSRVENVRVGVAGHNLFDVAHAWLLAGERGVRDGIEFEMLLGMAQGQAEAVRRTVGSLLLYTPVVHPGEFDVAIAYLIRRLEEGASQDNFMSAVFSLVSSPPLFAREEERFRASLVPLATPEGLAAPASHRVADRYAAVGRPGPGRFENTPDSDPSVASVRQWGSAITDRIASSTLGVRAVQEARVDSAASLDSALARVQAAGAVWGTWSGAARGAVLHAVGDALEANRAALIEVMAAETGKTIDQADPEVSEAIDFAHFYGSLASQLDDLDGATFTPATLTLVAPPWNFPVAIPAGSTLAALAAGSAVVLKPAPPAERSGAVLASIIETALDAHGAPADVLAFLQVSENELGQQLIASPMVDQVILTGAYETAELFRSFRSDLPLLAETSGKNAVIVTPSSDLDLAVKDVVASAFGHAGQKCSAASLVVMVGSVAKSKRFRNQLLDAVSSLTVGYPTDAATQMGPIIEPASGKLLAGLTTLGAGETWAVEPKQLDETGKLWSPGVRQGIRRGSEFHRTEYFGPILGMMTADTLDEAIDIVNEVDYGLTSGLHSLDPAEIGTWLGRIQAGQPLRQPRHHGRHRPPTAVRWLEEVGCRCGHEGRWAELPARARVVGACSVDCCVRSFCSGQRLRSCDRGHLAGARPVAGVGRAGLVDVVRHRDRRLGPDRRAGTSRGTCRSRRCRCAWLLVTRMLFLTSSASSRLRSGPARRSTSRPPAPCPLPSPRRSDRCPTCGPCRSRSPTSPSRRRSGRVRRPVSASSAATPRRCTRRSAGVPTSRCTAAR
ncbi:bifunctional proline dehydrogenase/L-glutamate gamma-semialdehyde dehydrogenase [Sphingomonas sp. LR61]|uniref:bifunctional proline dehydrogenase/L-glutamate gamma-semialdehyde dehydrogenase n=1 Tax=Sphingomonas sp. LR61 TaxID=3050234 RepID=UPI002FE0B9C6